MTWPFPPGMNLAERSEEQRGPVPAIGYDRCAPASQTMVVGTTMVEEDREEEEEESNMVEILDVFCGRVGSVTM
jgi:hypothetical protein